MAAGRKAAQWVVTAPLVAATLGKTVLHFRAGDVLPEGVDVTCLDNLRALGFVAEGEVVGEPGASPTGN